MNNKKCNRYYVYLSGLISLLLFVFCADYDLLEQDPPIPPDAVDLKITRVTDSSVTINWTKCDNDSFLNYVVKYAIGNYVGNDGNVFDTLSFAADTFITVKGLRNLTPYAFRIIVSLTNGASTPSPIVDTTTFEDLKGKLKLTWIPDSTNAQLIWTKSVLPCIRYRVFSDTTATVDSTDSLKRIVTDTVYRITDQTPGKEYWYRVYAENEMSYIATSNIVKVLLQAP